MLAAFHWQLATDNWQLIGFPYDLLNGFLPPDNRPARREHSGYHPPASPAKDQADAVGGHDVSQGVAATDEAAKAG